MRGLILNNILSTKNNLMAFTPVLLLLAVVAIVFVPEVAYSTFIYVVIVLYPILYISCYQKDFSSNWNRLELVMPVKRSSVVLSKYICFLLFLAMGFLIAVIYTAADIIIGTLEWNPAIISMFLLALGTTISAGALFYPLVLNFGGDKAEAMLLITFVLSIIPLYLAMQVGSRVLELEQVFDIYGYPSFMAGYFIFTVALYVISYFVAKQIYAKKEF